MRSQGEKGTATTQSSAKQLHRKREQKESAAPSDPRSHAGPFCILLDPPVIQQSYLRPELRSPWLKLGSSVDLLSLISLLKRKNICIFPPGMRKEGTRNKDFHHGF